MGHAGGDHPARQIFVSYSHRDEAHKDRLLVHLKLLERQGLVAPWTDRQIMPAEEWEPAIEEHLEAADLIILLISADFLASEYCWGKELAHAMARHHAGTAAVLPVFVEPCDWARAPFGRLQGVPKDAKPIAHFANPNDGWVQVAAAIRVLAEGTPGPVTGAPPSPVAIPIRWTGELRIYGEGFAGRVAELRLLDGALNEGTTRVLSLWAEGGAGKTRLMFQWLRQVSVDGWRGLGSVFVHSFYSQGSDDQRSASSDPFFDQALTHFGYRGPVIADPAEKGRCLAGLLTATGGLLVLDGLEPLQNPPRDARSGELRDMAVRTLLLTLANAPAGLCVLTTRQELPELKARVGATVAQHPLNRLNLDDGVALLHELEVKGRRDELRAAVKDYHGHAYSLMLLGTYLRNATEDHDIRQRHDFALLDEDKEHDHHAQHIFTTYETYLGPDSPEIALLRLLGFFNRPASRELIDVLRAAKRVVYELDEEAKKAQQARQRMRQLGMDVGSGSEPEPEPQTVEDRLPDAAGPLLELRAADWQRLLRRLAGLRLLSVADDGSLDSHPLLREHFAEELQIQFPDAFQAGHRRLYEHLCGTTAYQPDTLDGLQPLYQAVTHGCLAGRQQEACDEVYFGRILRGASYSTKQLGAVGADLGAVTAFFEESWSRVSPNLSPEVQRWLLNQAAFYLRALGRPGEAIDPMQAGGEKHVAAEDWQNATIAYDNLSELEVTLGRLAGGVADGRLAIDYADRSGNAFRRMGNRTTAAAALHQTGEREDAQALFAEAERLQAERQPELPLLYSLQGFRYVDLILAPAERLVWQVVMNAGEFPALAPKAAGPGIGAALASGSAVSEALAACAEAERRAIQTLQWAVAARVDLLSVALDHLSLARARLYRALLTGDAADPATVGTTRGAVTTALSKLRQASDLGYLPKALLANVLQAGAVAGQLDEARHYLAEAQLIAERGPMPLHLADVQLHRARLFFRDDLAAAQGSLAEARRLIDRHGYHRRDGELADAEEALANWAESHR